MRLCHICLRKENVATQPTESVLALGTEQPHEFHSPDYFPATRPLTKPADTRWLSLSRTRARGNSQQPIKLTARMPFAMWAETRALGPNLHSHMEGVETKVWIYTDNTEGLNRTWTTLGCESPAVPTAPHCLSFSSTSPFPWIIMNYGHGEMLSVHKATPESDNIKTQENNYHPKVDKFQVLANPRFGINLLSERYHQYICTPGIYTTYNLLDQSSLSTIESKFLGFDTT